ncbi:MAG: hypothetical protein P8P00_09805 [Polaribacter sp.]|nr:hypothetical protein [Polaribacter sp.]
MVYTIQDQIRKIKPGFNHLVILGAGASKATCIEYPELNGMQIPLMNDLPKVIDITEEIKDLPAQLKDGNFETIFSDLYKKEGNTKRLQKIEQKLYTYFDSLELPNKPTIYDHLILSLRDKDVIATFNWDPFLWQAYLRSKKLTKNLPQLLFLHGNVAIGYCEKTLQSGPKNALTLDKKTPFTPTKLLYPIGQKNYDNDPFIKRQWDALSYFLDNSTRITLFGYAAPVSDIEAINIMKKAWGKPLSNRTMEQIEIINTATKEGLLNTWKDFIHTHHYDIINDYYKSSINKFPRRTGEAFEAQYLDGKFHEENYPPKFG